ncbi:MAG TPA: type IX secretion system membrane protein PorP/SprF [Bacteroidales bacterium]|nr:type IX secretion system membrane protein PorP/SprF [Bacteroidales bacterium]
MNPIMKTYTTRYRSAMLILMLILAAFLQGNAYSQQIPNFSLYNMNHYLLNPAATGVTDRLPVSLSYRKIWLGIDNSPSVQYLSGNMLVTKDMGVGAKLLNYQAGPLRKTGLEGSYSYHLSLGSGDTKLSFGLSLLLYQFNLNKSDLVVEDIDDQVFMGTENMIVPDAGFGTYLYGTNYYVGLSVPQLFQRNIDLKSDIILQQKQVRHYYLHGGYIFEAGTDFKIEPSLLLKFIEAGIFQADINALVTYKDMVNFGISYRTEDALSFQLGYKNPDLFIGYAYDLILSGLRSNTSGSHEILFTYNFDNFLVK